MTFKESFHPKIKSDLKKIDKNVVSKIKTVHLDAIMQNPYASSMLKGKLSNVYSYHFKENRVEYRIAYEIQDKVLIFYYMVSKRENFYKNLEKRV